MDVCKHTIEIYDDKTKDIETLLFAKVNQIETNCGERYSWMGPTLKYCMFCGKEIVYDTRKYKSQDCHSSFFYFDKKTWQHELPSGMKKTKTFCT